MNCSKSQQDSASSQSQIMVIIKVNIYLKSYAILLGNDVMPCYGKKMIKKMQIHPSNMIKNTNFQHNKNALTKTSTLYPRFTAT